MRQRVVQPRSNRTEDREYTPIQSSGEVCFVAPRLGLRLVFIRKQVFLMVLIK